MARSIVRTAVASLAALSAASAARSQPQPTFILIDVHAELVEDLSFGEAFSTSVATGIAANGVVVGHAGRTRASLTEGGIGFARIATSRNMLEDVVSILPRAGQGRLRNLRVKLDETTLRITATGEMRNSESGASVAFRWVREAGATEAIQHFPVGAYAAPLAHSGRAVNAAGVKVGAAELAGDLRPCVWLPNGMGGFQAPVFLPLLAGDTRGQAESINDNGWIVGYTTDQGFSGVNPVDLAARHAALWKPDGQGGYTLVDITSQIASGAGFASINQAFSINNRNEIVGFGATTGSEWHAVLLQPDFNGNGVADFMDELAEMLSAAEQGR